jgi:hypothetical protein
VGNQKLAQKYLLWHIVFQPHREQRQINVAVPNTENLEFDAENLGDQLLYKYPRPAVGYQHKLPYIVF